MTERHVFGAFATNLQYREARARYRFALGWVRGCRVLDIGCGARGGPQMLAEVSRTVVGVDVVPAAVAEAARRFSHPRVRYAAMVAERLAVPAGAVEAVTCFEVLEHVADPAGAVAEIGRALIPGGVAICSTPNARWWSPDGRPRNPSHEREWTAKEFAALLSAVFGQVALYGERRGPRVTGWLKFALRVVKALDPFGWRRHLPPRALDLVSRFLIWLGGGRLTDALTEDDFTIRPGVEDDDEYMLAVCRGAGRPRRG